MNELKIFRNSDFGELGVMTIDDKEYFPAIQCAQILGYSNPRKAIIDHCETEGVTKRYVPTSGGTQEVKYISEGNLYRLIVRSKLPAAKKFERWVFDEVLPEIRRSGGYGSVNIEEVITKAVTTAVSETIKAIVPILERPAPDMLYNAYESDDRRKYNRSVISQLSPELRTEIDDMIISCKYTYAEIKAFLAERGVGVSCAAIGAYKKHLYRR